MISELLSAFAKRGFVVTLYSDDFKYNPDTVLGKFTSGFPPNIVQYVALSRCPRVNKYLSKSQVNKTYAKT